MRDFSVLKKNILQYLEYKGVSKYEFYQKTGISNGVLSQKGGMSEDNTLRFLSYYTDINPEWLLTGKGSMIKDETNIIAEPVPTYRKTKDAIHNLQMVPLFNLEATMGVVPLLDGDGIDQEKIIDYIAIPSLPTCDGATYAYGDSMYPLLKAGDIIAYKKIEVKRENIYFGEIYFLAIRMDESSTMKTIKFVQQSDLGDEYVRIVSQNQHHAPKDIKLSKIAAMALVRASIRLHN